MIPVYRTQKPEKSINMLAKHFGKVLVYNHFTISKERRRVIADKLRPRPYFGRVETQIGLWHKNGGILISSRNQWDRTVGENDAIYFAECPRSIEMMDTIALETNYLCVVYQPLSWEPHFRMVERICREKPIRELHRARNRMCRMIELLESRPKFTLRRCFLPTEPLFHAEVQLQPSSAPELSEA